MRERVRVAALCVCARLSFSRRRLRCGGQTKREPRTTLVPASEMPFRQTRARAWRGLKRGRGWVRLCDGCVSLPGRVTRVLTEGRRRVCVGRCPIVMRVVTGRPYFPLNFARERSWAANALRVETKWSPAHASVRGRRGVAVVWDRRLNVALGF